MNENLHSFSKLKNDLSSMKLLSLLLNEEQRKTLNQLEAKVNELIADIECFNTNFSDAGWCAYDSISTTLIKEANEAFSVGGIESGEAVLVRYYTEDIKNMIHYLKGKSKDFSLRYDLIIKAFNDHFEGRYHASVPVFLMVIDGALNDYTKSKGFFASDINLSVWDCLVGCDDALIKIKNIFNQSRKKTNLEQITLPYRNGILHGRDLNYGNALVSSKCVALMYALADWMSLKDNEELRKEKYIKATTIPKFSDIIKKSKQNSLDKKEIGNWCKKDVIINISIPAIPTIDDCAQFPYIIPFIEMFDAWGRKNYGKLSNLLSNMFSYEKNEKKRAGECRTLFENKIFEGYELVEVEERACSLSRLLFSVTWDRNGTIYKENLEFGCVYKGTGENVGLPWKDNGSWVIMPWKVQDLYK